jgi:hypothetical protein
MRLILSSLIVYSLLGLKASAQTRNPTINDSDGIVSVPDDLKKMLEEFGKALKNNDKSRASMLSHFPLKNLVNGAEGKKSKKEFEASLKESTFGFCYGSKGPEKEQNSSNWIRIEE